MAPEAVGPAPVAHQDQDGGERQQLADLDADIEGQQVGDQAIRRDVELADLGRQAEAVEKAEDQGRQLGVRLKPEPALVGAEIVERLVDDREPDDRVDQV